MPAKISYYTLLFINEDSSKLGNGVSGTYSEKIAKYVKCCSSLNKSLVLNGQTKLKVITNNSDLIKKIDSELECIEIKFATNVDPSIPFASAHCKLDVFNYFSTLSEKDYSILLDSDVLCINSEAKILKRFSSGLPVIYDITDQQFQGCGTERVCKDKELIVRKSFNDENFISSGIWAGGEFIGGSASFYKALYSACKKILPVYISNHEKLFHNGDEMIVSCALEYLIQKKKIFVFDAGISGLIGRYYDSSTNHVQHIWKYFKTNMFVHLPMDKDFLSSEKIDFSDCEKMICSLETELQNKKTFIEATVRADRVLQKLIKAFYKIRAFIKKMTGHGNAPVEY
ncbi:MAG: hypothetical protein KBT21_01475 [Treponema sp.]|nr:hypothetical protein [Candidatus Treponema merdequi]